MFDRLIHLWARYVGEIGAWHARSNYPRNEHGVLVPIYGSPPPSSTIGAESNVMLLRIATEERHG